MVSSKRPRDEGQPARRRHFHIPKAGLEALGGEWARQAPFEGHENALYEWISDPALWARVVLSDIDMPNDAESHSRTPSRVKMLSCAADEVALDANEAATVPNEGHVFHAERSASSSRSQHRLGQLHLGFREALDADGFVLWRLFPALGPSHLVLRQAGMPPNRLPLCRFTLKSHKVTPSCRYGPQYETRSYPAAAIELPPWAAQARDIIRNSTFEFMGAALQLVDNDWMVSRFRRKDALLHALCESSEDDSTGECRSARVLAAALTTPFPAERLLRSLVLADHSDEILYIDAIVATEKGAGYRLLHDLVTERRQERPNSRLIVVLMAVCSSQVLASYARWRFCYGGVIDGGAKQPRRVCNRLHRLQMELARFEQGVGCDWQFSMHHPVEHPGKAATITSSNSVSALSAPPSLSDEPELESHGTAASNLSDG